MMTPKTNPTPTPPEQESETVEIPISAAPDARPGSTISFKVISVDSESGVINASPVSDETEETMEEKGGSDQMAEGIGNQEEESQ